MPTLGFAGGTSGIDTVGLARVRLVNATGFILDLASSGVVAAGNAAIRFGEASSCTPTNALLPNLSVRVAGTFVPLPGLAPAYQSGVNYTVVAYAGSTVTTVFATIADLFLPVEGAAALRVFNASNLGTSYDVYVTLPGARIDSTPPVFSNVLPGTFSIFRQRGRWSAARGAYHFRGVEECPGRCADHRTHRRKERHAGARPSAGGHGEAACVLRGGVRRIGRRTGADARTRG